MGLEKQSILTMDQCAWEFPLSPQFCGGQLAQGHRHPGQSHSLSGPVGSGTRTLCNHPWECAPAYTSCNVFLNTPRSSCQGAEMDIPYDSLETHPQAPCPRSKGNQGRPQRNPRPLYVINLWSFVFDYMSCLRHVVKLAVFLLCDLGWDICGPQLTPLERDSRTRWPIFLRTMKKEHFYPENLFFFSLKLSESKDGVLFSVVPVLSPVPDI